MSSIGSGGLDERHIAFVAACAQPDEQRARELLADESLWDSDRGRDALWTGLQKASARGNLTIVRLLLDKGAAVNARRENDIPAVFKAAEAGHARVVEELLKNKANPDWANRNGHSALFPAIFKGQYNTVQALLDGGANINLHDKEGKTPLLYPLAAEKPGKWKLDMLELLLQRGADVEARDNTRRTPLLWAAATGRIDVADLLLQGKFAKKANIAASNDRGRTSLHLAAENNHEDMVKFLLNHGADPRTISDGGWTPLHNAAQAGHVGIVDVLLKANANVNSELFNGMTPLHWAAHNGHTEVVKLLLTKPNINLAIKDSFDRTPVLCAAERYHRDIVQLLSPARAGHRLTEAALGACRGFDATIVDFGSFRGHKSKHLVFKHSVYDLIYGLDPHTDKPKVPILPGNLKYNTTFRWIHLPANNIAWMEALITKSFIEGGHRDIEDFKAIAKCFGQEHRGPTVHSHFMRTLCQHLKMPQHRTSGPVDRPAEAPAVPQGDAKAGAAQPDGATTTMPKKPSVVDQKGSDTPKSDSKKQSKAEQFAERHPKKKAKRTNGPPGTKSEGKDSKGGDGTTRQSTADATKGTRPNGKIVLFMPFLHYETDERRDKMSKAIKRAHSGRDLPEEPGRDDLLLHAYLNGTPRLHTRRTLDQFFYHGIDTSDRDRDQVVYRYCHNRGLEPRIFMVDQLWMVILSQELIITSFPQRWEQPKHDPLNVLDGLIQDMNAETRPPVQSVYDLSLLITGRCSGMFDRHRWDNEGYQFIEMFESSIGEVTNKESKLFNRFNRASAAAGKWLKLHRRDRRTQAKRLASVSPRRRSRSREGSDNADPAFVDALLDIDIETSLLAEIKDIRDELNIILMVLSNQSSVLHEFLLKITDEMQREEPKKVIYAVNDIRKRSREQERILEIHRKDLERMDKQAEGIYTSLTHLLDLKQKHANAFEARFARDQAVIAGRQGQTIMVFTLVTIIFLPMSFIAAFFAINFDDLVSPLKVAYVAKYTFGIGLGISIPLIVMAFTVEDIWSVLRQIPPSIRRLVRRRRRDSSSAREVTESGEVIWDKLDKYASAGRSSMNRSEQRNPLSLDGFSPVAGPRRSSGYDRDSEYEDGMLSPLSAVRPRGYSGGRTTSLTWARARASFERGRGRISEDLERGRNRSAQRTY